MTGVDFSNQGIVTMGRSWTVSIALPGSVLSLCRRDEQRVQLASQIARALSVYSIDEIIIYDDTPPSSRPPGIDTSAYTGDIDPCGYLDHLLQYLEMPPFMRKTLLPLHPNLRQAGMMSNLEIPSHPHPRHWVPYAEGVTLPGATPSGKGTLVDIGHKTPVIIKQDVPPKTRITLRLDENDQEAAEPVDPSIPRSEGGFFWGYTTRRAETLSAVFEGCTYEGGYDMSIGTSERGTLMAEAFPERKLKKEPLQFQHLLVVFGGPRGIEYAAESDPTLNGMGIVRGRTSELFDHWINFLPAQGTRTVQTEEALWAGLAVMRRIWIDKE